MVRFSQKQTEWLITGGVIEDLTEMAFDLCIENSRFRPLSKERMEPSMRKEHMEDYDVYSTEQRSAIWK